MLDWLHRHVFVLLTTAGLVFFVAAVVSGLVDRGVWLDLGEKLVPREWDEAARASMDAFLDEATGTLVRLGALMFGGAAVGWAADRREHG